jgi:hypothetical protein
MTKTAFFNKQQQPASSVEDRGFRQPAIKVIDNGDLKPSRRQRRSGHL